MQSTNVVAITYYYDVFNNNGIFDGYHNGSHFEWWLISIDQYNFRMVNAPNAVENFLYAEKYAAVVGPIRTALANVCANTTSDFATANAQITSLEQAFDDYLAAIETINAFEEDFPSKTPDATTPVSDIAVARAALQNAANSGDITNTLKILKAFDEIIIEKQPTAIIANNGTSVTSGIQASANNIIRYTSDNAEVLTITEDGATISPVALGSTTITLTTATSQTHYAAMPVTTAEVSVIDAFILNPKNVETYTSGDHSTVILNRTLPAGYSTIALPFDTSIEQISGNGNDKVFTLCNVSYTEASGYTFYFTEVEGGVIAAGQPYVIFLNAEVENPSWENITCGELSAVTISRGGWDFVSNFQANTSMTGKYGVVNSKNKIMKGGAGATLNAFTAYFRLNAQTKASVHDSTVPAGAIPLFSVTVRP